MVGLPFGDPASIPLRDKEAETATLLRLRDWRSTPSWSRTGFTHDLSCAPGSLETRPGSLLPTPGALPSLRIFTPLLSPRALGGRSDNVGRKRTCKGFCGTNLGVVRRTGTFRAEHAFFRNVFYRFERQYRLTCAGTAQVTGTPSEVSPGPAVHVKYSALVIYAL